MHLFNQTINSFSSQVADLPISFNPDIFEANLVNLVLLTGGVFYLGSNALSESLTEQHEKNPTPPVTLIIYYMFILILI